MSTKITFISLENLKANYIFDENIEDAYVMPNVKKIQDFRVKPLLGETLYNQMTLEISGNTLTPQHKYMIEEYIQPMIAYGVLAEVLYTTAYKIKNEGIGNGDDKSAQYRFKEIIQLSNKYEEDAKQYENLLLKYMIDNGLVIDCRYQYKSKIYFPDEASNWYGNTIAHINNRK